MVVISINPYKIIRVSITVIILTENTSPQLLSICSIRQFMSS
ncbi:hypothetical protein FDUTEX481_01783 [Tolypothrix sp. PCC 7601]|nr:hypothetical protein FDUTEX481_01783 [Tolypothrix sp. PCC 7601]